MIAMNLRTDTSAPTAVSAGASTTLRVAEGADSALAILDNNSAITPAGSNDIISTSSVNSYMYQSGFMIAPTFNIALTETISTAESLSTIRKLITSLTETLDIIEVHTIALTETITTSESYLNFKKGWKNTAKSITSWINQDKS